MAGATSTAAYADDLICPPTATGSLSFSPATIHQGQQTTVTWNLDAPEPSCPLTSVFFMETGADGPTLSNHGSMVVTPGATREWQLWASFNSTSGADGQSHDERGQITQGTVTVLPPVPVTASTTRITANTAAQRELFVRAVSTPNETVIVDGTVNLDLSWLENIQIASGVQLLGERSVNPKGPRLFTPTRPRRLFLIGGEYGPVADNVHVSGIRFDGTEPDDPCASADTVPDSDAVSVFSSQHVEIDHAEFYKWRGSAVNVHDDDLSDTPSNRLNQNNTVWVHDSYFHDNQHPTTCTLVQFPILAGHGAGYGVNVGDGGYALIEKNVFENNRHAVASNGKQGSGYYLYRNLFLNPGIDSVYGPVTNYNHQIDVHGLYKCGIGEGYNCGPGGEYFDVAYNSVLARSSAAIQLRGNPSDPRGMSVENNRFFLPKSAAMVKSQSENNLVDNGGNIFGTWPGGPTPPPEETISGITRPDACDFDGDGTADSLMATGVAWWYTSSRLGGQWTYLAQSPALIGDIRSRDVNGDGLCDAVGPGGDVHLGEHGRVWDSNNEYGSPIAMARNSSGVMELAGSNSVDTAYHRVQAGNGTWSGSWQLFNGTLRSVALETNGNGRMEAIAVDKDDRIFVRQQTRPGDWSGSGWDQLEGELRSVALARDSDGRLEAFGTNAAGQVFHRTQKAVGVWTGSAAWSAYEGSLSQVAAEANADGTVELFGVNSIGQIFRRVQKHSGDWTGTAWQPVAGELEAVALARNSSGKLEEFGTNKFGELWHRIQTGPGDWTNSNWQSIDGTFSQIAAETNTDGKVDLFAVDAAGGLQDRTQKNAGTWDGSAWAAVDGTLRPTRPVIPALPLSLTAGDRSNTLLDNVNMRFSASFGTTPYHWSVSGLPPGLSMDANGSVTGQPTQKGSYRVVVTVRDSSNPSATVSAAFTWAILSGPCWGTTTDHRVVPIPDLSTVSLRYINGCTFNASSSATVGLDITYPHVGDLYIKLVAPSGHEFVLQNRAGGTSANLNKTFTVNLSSEPMEGIWSVVVLDQVQGGVGQVNQVTLKLHD